MSNIENQGFVEQDTALESMRASDFDCYSAYGEVIDNAIQAKATEIRVEIEERKDRSNTRSKKIGRIIFADNGSGMDIELLHKCLKLGHSSRYNDRSGIGRFGVGMTLGAIHECRRVEVYSKSQGGEWHYTYIDLDEIKSGELKFIPRPVNKSPNHEIAKYIEDSGTVVIWTKYDKQIEKFEDIIEESKFWIGRTFRKFIWGTAKGYSAVSIYLNTKQIPAFDPLFHTKDNTGFETEPVSKLFPINKLPWNIPLAEQPTKQKSNILINISLLPDEYIRTDGSGGDNFAQERFINRNEGISILRNDREVFFGNIPFFNLYSKSGDKELSRFIGCEISFDAELDTEFAVKNIKRGAVPVRELKGKILDLIKPTFKTQLEKIRDYRSSLKRDAEDNTEEMNAEIGVSGTHSVTNTLLKAAKDTLLKNDRKKPDEADLRIAKKVNPKIKASEIEKVIEGLRENGITIDEREFIGESFIDMDHGNQLKTLFYNTNSTFYKSFSSILNEIEKKDTKIARDYKVLMDLIFVGYMLAESKIDPEEEFDGASFATELKQNWAISLSKILKKWQS
jgi:hypothetical protein